MKKGDFLWGLALLIWIVILVVPASRVIFMSFTNNYPYVGGFIKFSILATMGDMLGVRLSKGEWIKPKGFIYKGIIWGIIGMMVTLVFTIFMEGTLAAQVQGKLPFKGSIFAQAFLGSTIMNLTFGPMMMVFHRFSEMYIDLKYDRKGKSVSMKDLIESNDWNSLVEFSWLKTCPFFWIPAHTIVFLLPAEYRVMVSAFLSIALGILLAMAKKEKKANIEKVISIN